MRNEILTTGQRLKYLMNKNGIKNAPALAEAMYAKHIMEYPKKLTAKECHQNTGRTINTHLSLESPEKLSGLWIKRYCDFFNCSANFILGYDSMPSPEVSTVHDLTGLSESSIKKLENFTTNQKSIISQIIDHPDFKKAILQTESLSDKEAISATESDVIKSHFSRLLTNQKSTPVNGNMIEQAMIYSLSTLLTQILCDITDTELFQI